jgi:V8-like Glu-specific endopeptidase
MKKYLFSCILLCIFIYLSSLNINLSKIQYQSDVTTPEKLWESELNAINSTISIFMVGQEGFGRCSGIVLKNTIDESIILTAKHCISINDELYVENILATKATISMYDDLAYIVIPSEIPNKQEVIMAKENAKRFDIVFLVGYPDNKLFIESGYITHSTKDWQFSTANSISGCSGGGIFNESGELIGIIWGSIPSDNVSIFEPISDVKKFLEENNL